MIEVYKHEVGTSVNTWPQDWRFYWEGQNVSGGSPTQICRDIALALEGIFGWFSALREFWPVGSRCHLYRLRRMLPTMEPWVDLYYQFNDYGGRFFLDYGTSGSVVNMRWVTDAPRIHNARSELRYFPADSFAKDQLVGQFLEVCKAFGDLHTGPHVTANGDNFSPGYPKALFQFFP